MEKVEISLGKTRKMMEKGHKSQQKGAGKKPGCKISQRNIHRRLT